MGYKKHFDRFDVFSCQILFFPFKPLRKLKIKALPEFPIISRTIDADFLPESGFFSAE